MQLSVESSKVEGTWPTLQGMDSTGNGVENLELRPGGKSTKLDRSLDLSSYLGLSFLFCDSKTALPWSACVCWGRAEVVNGIIHVVPGTGPGVKNTLEMGLLL